MAYNMAAGATSTKGREGQVFVAQTNRADGAPVGSGAPAVSETTTKGIMAVGRELGIRPGVTGKLKATRCWDGSLSISGKCPPDGKPKVGDVRRKCVDSNIVWTAETLACANGPTPSACSLAICPEERPKVGAKMTCADGATRAWTEEQVASYYADVDPATGYFRTLDADQVYGPCAIPADELEELLVNADEVVGGFPKRLRTILFIVGGSAVLGLGVYLLRRRSGAVHGLRGCACKRLGKRSRR